MKTMRSIGEKLSSVALTPGKHILLLVASASLLCSFCAVIASKLHGPGFLLLKVLLNESQHSNISLPAEGYNADVAGSDSKCAQAFASPVSIGSNRPCPVCNVGAERQHAFFLEMNTLPVGTLTWTEQAEDIFFSLLDANQFPTSCSLTKWMVVHRWSAGIGSQLHLAIEALLLGLSRGRTVLWTDRYEDHPFRIHELLEPLSSCQLNLKNPGAKELAFYRPSATVSWLDVLENSSVVLIDVLHLPMRGEKRKTFDAHNHDFHYLDNDWFEGLWTSLVNAGAVSLTGGRHIRSCDPVERKYMLFALTIKWILRPNKEVCNIAKGIYDSYKDIMEQDLSPLVAIHLRRGDKLSEDPFYREHRYYRGRDEVLEIFDDRSTTWKGVYVMSDSPSLIQSIVANRSGYQLPVSTPIMYDSGSFNSTRLLEGDQPHGNIPIEDQNTVNSHLLASLWLIGLRADQVVMTCSSNIGRLLLELMGATHRVAQVVQEGPLGRSLDVSWFHHP